MRAVAEPDASGRTLESGKYQRRYCCKRYNNHLEVVACGRVFRDAKAVEAYVKEQVIYRLTTPEIAAALAPEEDSQRAEELTHKIIGLRKRRDLIKRQYARGDIDSLEDYKLMRNEVETVIDECQAELSKLRTTKAANLLPADGKIHEAFEDASVEWLSSIYDLLIDHVEVRPGHPGGHTWNGYRFNPDHITIVWRH